MSVAPMSPSTQQALAADARTLNALKMQAGSQTPAAIKETAKQFESLFMRELIKSMREATMKSGLLDNPGSDLGADLLDQQFAVQMSGQPGGLSDLIAKQLSRQMGIAEGTAEDDPLANLPSQSLDPAPLRAPQPVATRPITTLPGKTTPAQADFVLKHNDIAARIEKESGIPAGFMIGQAGHETGWGRFEIRNRDGSPSFNLFGIKAGPGWKGKVTEVTTTEYVNGVAQKKVAKFRAYDSYEDSFRDYARLISENPRYSKAREQTGSVVAFANGLQKAGYATDPEYANKLSRAINTTLRIQRAQA